MKFNRVLAGCLICVLGASNLVKVNAQENYYENVQGVKLTEKEYNFYTNMYWEGYQEYITVDDYETFKKMDVFDKEIDKKIVSNSPLTRTTSVTSNNRVLSITKVCSTNCVFSLVNSWNSKPTIRSYDVIGVRLKGVKLVSKNGVLVTGANYSKKYDSAKSFDNGFGYSILLPNVENIRTTLTFTTTKGGTVYGSYQHAISNTTESISKQYTIGLGGYGGVFNFTGTAKNIYDKAPGVDISV